MESFPKLNPPPRVHTVSHPCSSSSVLPCPPHMLTQMGTHSQLRSPTKSMHSRIGTQPQIPLHTLSDTHPLTQAHTHKHPYIHTQTLNYLMGIKFQFCKIKKF